MCFSLVGRTDLEQVTRKRANESNLLEYANQNRHSGSFNDVEICAGNDRVPANKMVLSCFSIYFESMFKIEMKEKYQSSIEIHCVDGNSMKSLIEFIYTGDIDINSENVCDLIAASNYLQIDDVKQFCFDFVSEALSPNNCFIVLGIAVYFQNGSLATQTLEMIARNFDAASSTIEFKNLKVKALRNFISKQDRSIVNEGSVFNAILGWIKHDERNRASELIELLKLVVLHKLPPPFFEEVISKENLVIHNPDLCQLMFQAQNKIFQNFMQPDKNTRILSLGGSETLSKVIEVYNCNDEPPLAFPDLPGGRDSGCAVAIRGFLYYLGGDKHDDDEGKNIPTSSVWRICLSEKQLKWENVKPMKKTRSKMGATVFDGNPVAVGSQEPGECYLLTFNSWHNLPSLRQARSANALVACNGGLYAIGGSDNGEYLSSVECLRSGEKKWKVVSPMQTPRRWLAAVCCDGFIYAIGGEAEADEHDSATLKSVEKYDPSTDEWTYISDMHFCRFYFSACALKGRIFVVGGLDERDQAVKEIECYDPQTNEWSIVGKTDEELFHHSVVAI